MGVPCCYLNNGTWSSPWICHKPRRKGIELIVILIQQAATSSGVKVQGIAQWIIAALERTLSTCTHGSSATPLEFPHQLCHQTTTMACCAIYRFGGWHGCDASGSGRFMLHLHGGVGGSGGVLLRAYRPHLCHVYVYIFCCGWCWNVFNVGKWQCEEEV